MLLKSLNCESTTFYYGAECKKKHIRAFVQERQQRLMGDVVDEFYLRYDEKEFNYNSRCQCLFKYGHKTAYWFTFSERIVKGPPL